MLNTKPKLTALLTRSAPRRTSRKRPPTATQSEACPYSPGIAYLEAQEHIRDLSTRFLPKEDIRRAIAADQTEGTGAATEETGPITGVGPRARKHENGGGAP